MEEHNKWKHAVHCESQRLNETVHFHVSRDSSLGETCWFITCIQRFTA